MIVSRLLLAAAALHGIAAAEFLVVTRSAAGAWSLERAESVTLNGKDKVRRVTPAAGNPATWDAKSIGRVPAVDVELFTVIRRTAEGEFAGRQGALPDWQILLPDGLKPIGADSAANLWKAVAISFKRDRKDKVPASIRTEELYAIVNGPDAAALAASLASETGMHKSPGVDEAKAFQQLVSLLPAAFAAFPTGPGADRIREYTHTAMSQRAQTWKAGNAPITVLDEWLALAAASESAFSNDTKQAELRKQARETRQWLDRRVAILRTLDAGKQSDAFLLAYREFEAYDKSFTDLSTARAAHLKASAKLHFETGERARQGGDYASAIHHLRMAQWRDPQFKEAAQTLEEVRLEVARLSAQKFAELRRDIDPRSPKQVQVQRRLSMAEQYLADGKADEAEQSLKEADSIDKDEARIRLLEARVAVLRGDFGRALAILDLYAGLAVKPADFDEGEKLRAGIQYKIENSRKETQGQAQTLYAEQRFATALESAAGGLKLDNEDPQFLYQAGLSACVLRNCENATPLLRRFLDITDSTQGSREQRIAAMRLLEGAKRPRANTATSSSSVVSWFSGAPLDPGVFYDPISLAFQPKVARVKASDHLSVAYEWAGDQLKSVHTKYEDKKTGTNILKVVVAGAAASQGIGSTVGWRTPDRETNDFFFNYYDDNPQILKVSRDNVVVKSRKIPIGIPGIGGFGGLGMLGGLGGLRGAMGGMSGMSGMGGMAGMSGFGGVAGFGGVGGSGALRALATQRVLSSMGSISGAGSIGGMSPAGWGDMVRQYLPSSQNYSIHADPQGGSTSGFLTLWNSPRLDTEIAFAATGKRVAVGFSGNSFFHPFVWDAIHLFELDYDSEGRVKHAWEIDAPGAPRLDFTWDGRRLMQIAASPAAPGSPSIYTRSMQYSGEKLTAEIINHNGKTSRIEYKYDKQGRLIEAECQEDHSIDGRSRQIEFVTDIAKGGKR